MSDRQLSSGGSWPIYLLEYMYIYVCTVYTGVPALLRTVLSTGKCMVGYVGMHSPSMCLHACVHPYAPWARNEGELCVFIATPLIEEAGRDCAARREV